MPTSPAQPPSGYRPDKFIGLVSAGTPGSPTNFVGAYVMGSDGQPMDIPRVLGASAGPVAALTGSTAEATLATVTIPAGTLGLNGRIVGSANFILSPSSANAKTGRIRLGGLAGTSLVSVAWTTNTIASLWFDISNQNDAAVQRAYGYGNRATDTVMAVTTPVASVIDTAAATTLVITGQLADGTESLTLSSWYVNLFNGA